MSHVNSVWSATANPHQLRARLEGEIKTDVVIIGGGYTGISTAYHLAEQKVDSVVLEEHRVGWGASGRNAGMVLTGYKESIYALSKKLGKEAAGELLQLSVDGIHLVSQIIKKHGIDCAFSNCGNFDAAYKPSHYEALKKSHEFMLEHFNYETHLVDKRDLQTEVDSKLYHGGLVDPHSYSFHPLNYVLGIAQAAESLGAVIYDQTPAMSITKNGQNFIVKTPAGQVTAKHLVVATNGYTKEITKKLMKRVVPIGSFIVATERLPKEIVERLIPNDRMIADTKNFLYYFRRTPDDRILLGGRVDFNGRESDEVYGSVRQNLLEVFPEMKDYKIEYRWGGMLGFTLDFMPHIGQMEDGTHFALGYCGHGASLSTLMGKLIAMNVLDPLRMKNSLEKLPLKRIPFHSQRVFTLSLVTKYYHFVDRYT